MWYPNMADYLFVSSLKEQSLSFSVVIHITPLASPIFKIADFPPLVAKMVISVFFTLKKMITSHELEIQL